MRDGTASPSTATDTPNTSSEDVSMTMEVDDDTKVEFVIFS